MTKKIQLTIPKPCHENWDKMTPVEQGKFCGSCQKEVVDFSLMNDRQLAEFFKKPSTGSVCGRFMTEQLDRAIDIPKKRIPWFRYFFQIALPAFLFSIKASAQQTKGRPGSIEAIKDTTDPVKRPVMGKVSPGICVKPPEPTRKMLGEISVTPLTANRVIHLKVVDENNDVIPYAAIETGVIGKGGVTNSQGIFDVNTDVLNGRNEIFVSAGNYERQAVLVRNILASADVFTVVLKPVVVVAGPIRPPRRMLMGAVAYVRAEDIAAMTISCTVVDESGAALQGAIISNRNGKSQYATNAKGFSSFTARKGDTLFVSYIGYQPSTIVVGSDKTLFIVLTSSQAAGMTLGMITISKPVKIGDEKIALMNDNAAHKNSLFRVFPNPAESGTHLNIEWKKAKEGYYLLELVDAGGLAVYQQEIWVDDKARLLGIDLPAVSRGNYVLSLTEKKTGKKFTEKLLVQ